MRLSLRNSTEAAPLTPPSMVHASIFGLKAAGRQPGLAVAMPDTVDKAPAPRRRSSRRPEITGPRSFKHHVKPGISLVAIFEVISSGAEESGEMDVLRVDVAMETAEACAISGRPAFAPPGSWSSS